MRAAMPRTGASPSPAVHVPDAGWMRRRRQSADGQHEMIREHLRVRPARAVHPADMACDLVAEGAQQLTERAVEMQAVPTAP